MNIPKDLFSMLFYFKMPAEIQIGWTKLCPWICYRPYRFLTIGSLISESILVNLLHHYHEQKERPSSL